MGISVNLTLVQAWEASMFASQVQNAKPRGKNYFKTPRLNTKYLVRILSDMKYKLSKNAIAIPKIQYQ